MLRYNTRFTTYDIVDIKKIYNYWMPLGYIDLHETGTGNDAVHIAVGYFLLLLFDPFHDGIHVLQISQGEQSRPVCCSIENDLD